MNGLDKSLERLIRVSVESKTSYHLFIGCGFDYNHKFFQGEAKNKYDFTVTDDPKLPTVLDDTLDDIAKVEKQFRGGNAKLFDAVLTSNVALGEVVPIPTLPPLVILIRSEPWVLTAKVPSAG